MSDEYVKHLQDLVTTLKVMAPQVDTMRGDLHNLQLQQVEQTGELKSIKSEMGRMETTISNLTSKIEGQPGADPLPSRVKALEAELARTAKELEDKLVDHKKNLCEQMDAVKADVEKSQKEDSDTKKSRLSGKVQVALAIIAGLFTVGGIAAQGYFASQSSDDKQDQPAISKPDYNYGVKK